VINLEQTTVGEQGIELNGRKSRIHPVRRKNISYHQT